jgi:AcrR family transcriptional regulator
MLLMAASADKHTDIAGSLRQRAVEQSLDAARRKAESRTDRFMKSALEILGETGRTDFTVLEVVERSKTSLRAFYQLFATKDELLLALIDKIMAESTRRWSDETAALPSTAALRLLFDRICAPAHSSAQDSINRGLTFYNDHLAESLPREYARVLSPLHQLIREILNRGIAEEAFRTDLDVETSAALIMQTVLGAMRLRMLGAELNGLPIDSGHIYEFCVRGLESDPAPG